MFGLFLQTPFSEICPLKLSHGSSHLFGRQVEAIQVHKRELVFTLKTTIVHIVSSLLQGNFLVLKVVPVGDWRAGGGSFPMPSPLGGAEGGQELLLQHPPPRPNPMLFPQLSGFPTVPWLCSLPFIGLLK